MAYNSNNKRVKLASANGITRAKLPFLMLRCRGQLSQTTTMKRRSSRNKMARQVVGLKQGMKEIRVQQICIKEEQRRVRAKFEAIESECEALRAETQEIMKQSASTGLRLAVMFEILKARESNNLSRAAELTHYLRELVQQQDQNGRAFEPTVAASEKEIMEINPNKSK